MAGGGRIRVLAGTGVAAGAVAGLAPGAQAAEFEVDRTDDLTVSSCTAAADDCTLRGAVTASNLAGTNDQIVFRSDLSGQISLGSVLQITDGVYIEGPASIAGGDATGLFQVDLAAPGEFVGFDLLRLTDGNAVLGGAIENVDGDVDVLDSVLTGNHATSNGGAISSSTLPATLEVYGSTVSGNSADQAGGGISAENAIIERSTIAGNTAGGSGGGVYFGFSGELRDVTVAGNSAGAGGGVGVDVTSGIDVFNSVIADNTAPSAPDAEGGTVDLDFSLLESPAGSVIGTLTPGSSVTGVDPQLGALQDNGGTNPLGPFTLRPAATSPVVDRGSAQFVSDQRGMARPFDVPALANSAATGADGGDMGAVELTLEEATIPPGGGEKPAPAGPKKKCKRKKQKKGSRLIAAGSAKRKCKKRKKGR